jgi:hypothetical protein
MELKMARKLTKTQVSMITNWFNQNWNGAGSILSYEDLPMNVINRLRMVSDHETIWMDIDRLIGDLATRKIYVLDN